MSARITITNLADVLAGFQATEDKIDLAVQYAITMTGLATSQSKCIRAAWTECTDG
jgi:predicted membrane GTPase involved in stress response